MNLPTNYLELLTNPLVVYGILGALYLVVIPVLLMFYFRARWYKTGAWERSFICFMVFFFFVGLLIVAPFFNFRNPERKIA
jgi:NAD(P)H-quinone oxidoreductase subunit L